MDIRVWMREWLSINCFLGFNNISLVRFSSEPVNSLGKGRFDKAAVSSQITRVRFILSCFLFPARLWEYLLHAGRIPHKIDSNIRRSPPCTKKKKINRLPLVLRTRNICTYRSVSSASVSIDVHGLNINHAMLFLINAIDHHDESYAIGHFAIGKETLGQKKFI